jgi:hypothetical protein
VIVIFSEDNHSYQGSIFTSIPDGSGVLGGLHGINFFSKLWIESQEIDGFRSSVDFSLPD